MEPVKSPKEGDKKLSANQRAEQAKKRNDRLVWVQDGAILKAVKVTLGLNDGSFGELLSGDLKEGDTVVTGIVGGTRESR